jgi:GTP-binding protein Era
MPDPETNHGPAESGDPDLDTAAPAEAGRSGDRDAGEGQPPTRAGFVALIGAPNAGKSTLLNALVGSKVSIVSHKVQTTRALVRGIAIEGAAQIVFVDTPGIFKPKRRLDRAMVTSAWGGAADADAVCLLLDARKGLDEEGEAILGRLPDLRRPKILILNKIDLIERSRLLELAAGLNERVPFAHTFMVSALKGDGTDRLKRAARRHDAGGALALSGGPDLRRALAHARGRDHPREDLRAPARGAALRVHRRDRPVAAAPDGSVRIEQTVFVERESQRKIVLGKGGQTIKAIASGAPRDRRDRGGAGAPLPVREGARELERRPGALPRDGAGVPAGRVGESLPARGQSAYFPAAAVWTCAAGPGCTKAQPVRVRASRLMNS